MQPNLILIISLCIVLLNLLFISSVNLKLQNESKEMIIDIPKTNFTDIYKKPRSLLVENALSRINTIVNPLKYGADYLMRGTYIDDQDEYNLKKYLESSYGEKETCLFNRQRFMEHLNLIRFKHQVKGMIWDNDLESQAKIYALKIKKDRNCKLKFDEKRMFIGEAYYVSEERLTEKELLQKWYRPAYYNYNFVNVTYNKNYDTTNNYPMALLLWDTVNRVGCAKVCCEKRELNICHFLPIVQDPNILEMKRHIKNNRFISGSIDGPISSR
jgi:hypothetical protein